MEGAEFKIDDIVTVDRYNHINDVQKGRVVGYGQMPISRDLTYKIQLNDIEIQSTGISIMESKNYKPVPDCERQQPRNLQKEIEEDNNWLKNKK